MNVGLHVYIHGDIHKPTKYEELITYITTQLCALICMDELI
jgi:hypothetical protein